MKKENEPFWYIGLFIIGTDIIFIGYFFLLELNKLFGCLVLGFGISFLYHSGMWFERNKNTSEGKTL